MSGTPREPGDPTPEGYRPHGRYAARDERRYDADPSTWGSSSSTGGDEYASYYYDPLASGGDQFYDQERDPLVGGPEHPVGSPGRGRHCAPGETDPAATEPPAPVAPPPQSSTPPQSFTPPPSSSPPPVDLDSYLGSAHYADYAGYASYTAEPARPNESPPAYDARTTGAADYDQPMGGYYDELGYAGPEPEPLSPEPVTPATSFQPSTGFQPEPRHEQPVYDQPVYDQYSDPHLQGSPGYDAEVPYGSAVGHSAAPEPAPNPGPEYDVPPGWADVSDVAGARFDQPAGAYDGPASLYDRAATSYDATLGGYGDPRDPRTPDGRPADGPLGSPDAGPAGYETASFEDGPPLGSAGPPTPPGPPGPPAPPGQDGPPYGASPEPGPGDEQGGQGPGARSVRAPRRADRRESGRRTFGQLLGLTVLGGLIPGTGLLAAGRRRAGIAVLAGVVVLLALITWAATAGRRAALNLLLDPDVMIALGAGLLIVGLIWVSVIVISHRLLRPRGLSTVQRFIGSGLVTLVALIVMTPMVVASQKVLVTHDLVSSVFAGADSKSATRQERSAADPWGGQRRVNVLLLGGDGGKGREGVRTDSVIVASIDTQTGNTVLLSLPRNLLRLPFPEDSPLGEAYPDGFWSASGIESESMLNAVYRNVPAEHPGVLDSDDIGADALKLGVGEAFGLRLDYYVLINLEGFSELIDALGGITVNVNERVAIGGSDEHGVAPRDYIEPGPNKHLGGSKALWYARGRYGSSDYKRMDRQRCAINAIIAQANPGQVLKRYDDIARASKTLVKTDIPSSLLQAFVDLSLKVKDAELTSVVFDNTIIRPAHADYDAIRAKAQQAVKITEKPESKSGKKGKSGSGKSKPDSDKAAPKPPPTEKAEGKDAPSDSLAQTCAYNPEPEQ